MLMMSRTRLTPAGHRACLRLDQRGSAFRVHDGGTSQHHLVLIQLVLVR